MDEKQLYNLKMRFFSNRYNNLSNWIFNDSIVLPDGITKADIKDWEEEKKEFIKEQTEYIDHFRQVYLSSLIEQLDVVETILSKTRTMLKDVEEPKDLKSLTSTIKEMGQIQKEIMATLKLDKFNSDLYDKNKEITQKRIDQILNRGDTNEVAPD